MIVPGVRGLALAAALGLGIGLYLALVVRWPTFLSVGIAALISLVSLLITASLGDDPARADAAWHDAAPDLIVRHMGDADDAAATSGRHRAKGRTRR